MMDVSVTDTLIAGALLAIGAGIAVAGDLGMATHFRMQRNRLREAHEKLREAHEKLREANDLCRQERALSKQYWEKVEANWNRMADEYEDALCGLCDVAADYMMARKNTAKSAAKRQYNAICQTAIVQRALKRREKPAGNDLGEVPF